MWEDYIKIDLKEMRSEVVGCLWSGINDELWCSVMNFNEHSRYHKMRDFFWGGG